MEKYYYCKGMCAALQYMSLNPVLYKTTNEEGKYKKIKMACECIEKGVCDKEITCNVFTDAPEQLVDDGINLRNKKF